MTGSRSDAPLDEEALRLPRPPGVIRRFWARHPVLADVLIAVVCLLLSAAPSTVFVDDADPDRPAVQSIVMNISLTVLILLACALLLRRRQWPVIASIGAYALSIGYLFMLEPAGGTVLLVTSYSIAVYRSTRAAWITLGVGMGTVTVLSILLQLIGASTWMSAVNGVAGQLTLALIGTLIGVNIGGRKRYIEAVIDRSRQLLVERDQQGQIAAAAERARIAREMHDVVSHSLTVVVALSEGAAATEDRQRAQDASISAAATARAALTEMRSMLGVLRDGDSDAPLAPGDPVSPQTTAESAQRAGYPVKLRTIGESSASAIVQFAIGRIVQEGVTNAMRHAPGARAISVLVDHSADPIVVEIENDGVTGQAGTTGFGIRGLQERAAHVGGTVRSGPAGADRWMLRAELPADGDAAREPGGTIDG
ncbi:sensor histidine kinase [Microbacterium sp.]|uniref:sensor histidine kinase n=1 Tax=Microbacterium sp. TaxID=51671 RepID=UPI003F96D211